MNVSTSWFENYVIRYLIGTIIGFMCSVLTLAAIHDPNNLQTPLIESIRRLKNGEISSTLFLIFSVLGFLYCYISSTPITIIHAARMLGALPARPWLKPRTWWLSWWLLLVISIAALVVLSLFRLSFPGIGLLAFIPALYIVFAQWAPLLATLQSSGKINQGKIYTTLHRAFNEGKCIDSGKFSKYYVALARKRTQSDAAKDLRSSYSHLREHSNSIFIVLLEISLAALIVGLCLLMDNVNWEARAVAVVILLLIWMTPTVFVWGIANSLEEALSEEVV